MYNKIDEAALRGIPWDTAEASCDNKEAGAAPSRLQDLKPQRKDGVGVAPKARKIFGGFSWGGSREVHSIWSSEEKQHCFVYKTIP